MQIFSLYFDASSGGQGLAADWNNSVEKRNFGTILMKNKLTGNKESDGMEPDRNTLLAVEHLNKSYDGTRVLTDLSLTLPPGTILGLIGENGAGKSTFAKCLLGIVRPDSGSILLDGKAFRPGSAAIAGIPQEFNLVDDLSVAENIFLGA